MQKSAKVEIRVTPEEKTRWAEAAGGPRRVSAWLRALANAAAEHEPLLRDPVIDATREALAPLAGPVEGWPARPLDAIGVDSSKASTGKLSGSLSARKTSGAPLVKTDGPVKSPCPRERFHRKGTYCAACKKIR